MQAQGERLLAGRVVAITVTLQRGFLKQEKRGASCGANGRRYSWKSRWAAGTPVMLGQKALR